MRIIKITANENGSHWNQKKDFGFDIIPEGCAVIPEDMETPNFPFGELTAEKIDGIMTVTSWKAGTIPESQPEPEQPVLDIEQLRADIDYLSLMTGVDL